MIRITLDFITKCYHQYIILDCPQGNYKADSKQYS